MSIITTEAHPEHLGTYRLIKRLAVGGMGEVFLAEQITPYFTRFVAIKRALPHVTVEGFAERLIDEARLMTRLHHGNIIHVHELKQDGDELYMVMEYLPGLDVRSINQKLKKQGIRWPAELAVYVVHEVCLGLDYAHKACDDRGVLLGVIHRDLSPSNILLGSEGEVKLIDFGVARARGGIHQSIAGSLQGKLAYVSPEQARGEALTIKTDLFSLGVTLFEMLSGVRPLEAEQDVELLMLAQKGQYLSLVELCQQRDFSLDPSLCSIVDRAMAVDPEARFDNAAHFAHILNEWLDKQSSRENIDRLALKSWLKSFLEPQTESIDQPVVGVDPFASAFAELFEKEAQSELSSLSASHLKNGITVTLSVDVQAQVRALEALPSIDEIDHGTLSTGKTLLKEEHEEMEESDQIEEDKSDRFDAKHLSTRLIRARYTAFMLLLVSVFLLWFTLSEQKQPLTFVIEQGDLNGNQITAITLDGEAWNPQTEYDDRTPLELCIQHHEVSVCEWFTPLHLDSYALASDRTQTELKFWKQTSLSSETKVMVISQQILKKLDQMSSGSLFIKIPSLTEHDPESSLPFKDQETSKSPQDSLVQQASTEDQMTALKAQALDHTDQKFIPKSKSSKLEPKNNQKLKSTQIPSTSSEAWFTFEVTPSENSTVQCFPAHPDDQARKVKLRDGLNCEISAPDHQKQQIQVQGKPRLIKVNLQRLARLNVRVLPATAQLLLNQELVSNPLKRKMLKPGTYTLQGLFVHEGKRWTEQQMIELKEGERRSIVIELKPPN